MNRNEEIKNTIEFFDRYKLHALGLSNKDISKFSSEEIVGFELFNMIVIICIITIFIGLSTYKEQTGNISIFKENNKNIQTEINWNENK